MLAGALTMGTMNVYVAGASKLAAAGALSGSLPAWLGGDAQRSIPRRPLLVISVFGVVILSALVAGFAIADDLVRATSACFVAVYIAAAASAARVLHGTPRAAALVSTALSVVVAAFSAWYLLVPVASSGCLLW